MTKEVWKDVVGYEGIYKVSSNGQVKSMTRYVNHMNHKRIVPSRILKQNKKNPYLAVTLSCKGVGKTKPVHHLMAESFFGHFVDGYKLVIDHIDNDKFNNTLDNLQIVTQRENSSKDRTGSSIYTGVRWHHRDNVWMSTIVIGGKAKYLGSFKKELDARNAYQNELGKIK